MGRDCCIDGCSRGWINGVYHGFRFKLDSDIYAQWVSFFGKENWVPLKDTTICFEHFEEKCIKRGKR